MSMGISPDGVDKGGLGRMGDRAVGGGQSTEKEVN